MSDINPTSQENIKQSLFSTDLRSPEELKQLEQINLYHASQMQHQPDRLVKKTQDSSKTSRLPPDMPLNEKNLEEMEKELCILEQLSPKQRSRFSDQLMQKESSHLIHPLIEQKFSQLQSIAPDELKQLIGHLKKNISHLKKIAIKLKEADPKKADFILHALQEIDAYVSLKQQQNLICHLQEQTTALVEAQQLDSHTGNVLLLFLAFAKSQMDQNDKAMLAGMEQVKVKTTQLELNAEEIKNNANQSVEGRHMSTTHTVLIAAAVFGLCLLALTGVGALAGMGLLGGGILAIGGGIMGSSYLALGLTAGVLTGLSVGSACIAAYKNPELSGLSWMTEVGPDDKKLMHSQNLISFFNTQTQKLNSQLGSTEKMFVENISDRSTQLGQQAGQAIDTLGQMMKTG